jgi:IS5 family transposase
LPRSATFKPWLLAGWYHLWDVKLAEAREDRASFRTFCSFSRTEAKPERTAFLRFRKAPVAQKLQCLQFKVMTAHLKSKAVKAVAA